MNTITPQYHIRKNVRGNNKALNRRVPSAEPSFKSFQAVVTKVGSDVADELPTIISKLDEPIMEVFSRYYGNVGKRVGKKIGKIYTGTKKAPKVARFVFENGITTIREKNFFEAFKENVFFPVTKLPKWTANWFIKKAQGVDSLNETATKIYRSDFFRDSRKLHELDEKTDIIKGMYDKTQSLIEKFAADPDNEVSKELLIDILTGKDKSEKSLEILPKADAYMRENLYKVSNKFFDKHTGNFNTAYERPLNRIVSGLIPVAFLANDAYNLSVLCGDSKDVSKKEAKERQKQEVSRVLTTAYIQLLTFGAFTRYVNTKAWFVPAISALTVLASETSSRLRLGKPITFLTKEQAKEYNKKQKEKEALKTQNSEDSSFKGKIERLKDNFKGGLKKTEEKQTVASTPVVVVNENKEVKPTVQVQSSNLLENALNSQNNSFKAQVSSTEKEKTEPKKQQKTLITKDTFKKGLAILTVGGFVLSFIKNSSWTKNSALIKTINKVGNEIKDKIYTPYAFKDFEFSTKQFDKISAALGDAKFKEVAKGHEHIKSKYSEEVREGVFKVFKSVLPSGKIDDVVTTLVSKLENLDGFDAKKVGDLKAAIVEVAEKNSSDIAENSFLKVGNQIAKTLDMNKVSLASTSNKDLAEIFAEAISSNVEKQAIKVETKIKPVLDLFTEPFKFIGHIGGMPFRIVSSALKASLSPITRKIAEAESEGLPLTDVQKGVKRFLSELFGEKKSKSAKISQEVFVNSIENLDKSSKQLLKYAGLLENAEKTNISPEELAKLVKKHESLKEKFKKYVGTSIEKSFNGVTQSSNKNTDLAMLSKLSSSLVTSAFLVADNYNMVMIKSDGEDKENAKEKAYERIIQRLSALFYQTMFINLFNSTFRSTYNSSLKGMAAVVAPNTITTEVVTRASIGMPIKRKTYDEIIALEEKNENRKGLAGKYFKFMRLLTGKKPLSERMPKDSKKAVDVVKQPQVANAEVVKTVASTNLLEQHLSNKK